MPLLTLLGQAATNVTIGDTSQLGALSSTGGLQIADNIGGTNQLGVITSTGGLTVGLTIGGTSQLVAFTSTGSINAGEAVSTTATGGFFFDYDSYNYKRRKKRKELEELKKEAEKIEDKLEKEIAIEFRKQEQEEERIQELQVLTRIAERHKEEIERIFNEKVVKSANRAIEQRNYSAMEALERELDRVREEEEFLLEATRIILNG